MSDTRSDAAGRCPVCGKTAPLKVRPFCSRRCADVDLHRWLAGAYVIPGAEGEEADVSGQDEEAPRGS